MYTAQRTPAARLRAYAQELQELYAEALTARDWERARRLWAQRQRVMAALVAPARTPAARPALVAVAS